MAASDGVTNANANAETAPEPDLARARRLVMELMAIPGKSGSEAAVARYITRQLRAAGVAAALITTDNVHRRTRVRGDTGNLVLKLPGSRRAPRRLLAGHMDTVPICVGSKPVLRGRTVRALGRAPGRATGLGADNRAACAALLAAALEITERGLPHPPVTFCWFVQEEVGLQGSQRVSKAFLGNPRLAFNWDGGGAADLVVGATGAYRMEIEVQGLASHAGAAPERGVSAIAIAARAIADLDRGGWHGKIEKEGSSGTSNVGTFRAGNATNVVADRATLRAEARSHDPVFRKRIVREIEQAFRRAAAAVINADGVTGRVKVAANQDYESFKLPLDEPCVVAAAAAVEAAGGRPEYRIADGGLDANSLTVRGVPTVTMGVGQRNAHTVTETLDLDDFELACRVALRLAAGAEPAPPVNTA